MRTSPELGKVRSSSPSPAPRARGSSSRGRSILMATRGASDSQVGPTSNENIDYSTELPKAISSWRDLGRPSPERAQPSSTSTASVHCAHTHARATIDRQQRRERVLGSRNSAGCFKNRSAFCAQPGEIERRIRSACIRHRRSGRARSLSGDRSHELDTPDRRPLKRIPYPVRKAN